VAVCGVGLANAGVGAAHAIATHPAAADGVVLVGAAGTYDERRQPLGSALVAGSVRCHGIGAGGRTPAELGFGGHDLLTLSPDGGPEVVSVAQASRDGRQAAAIAARYPNAVAEEMEGYAVALAARRFGVPAVIVRGISNRAGDRDRSRWQIHPALRSAGRLAAEALA
jgi:futalosine hydrolase